MRMVDLIGKKREGGELSAEEIRYMVRGITDGSLPDYQLSAMMMAIFFRGMTEKETLALTMAMAESGDMLELSRLPGIKADKHSTGGVGDKTSLALLPIAAACGLTCAKMSGRGLGHTGGTIDKLESIPGFSTELSEEAFFHTVETVGMSIMGQTAELAPADKKLYALRDVTATVESIPLIASSIMSKKLAAGADVIVLDVKTGSGAFMKKMEDARALAEEMVRIGKGAGKKTIAVLSDMDQPLGRAVGNAIEVREAIDTLKGEGPADFTLLVETLCSQMLIAGGLCESENEATEKVREAIRSGSAFEKLCAFVEAQGGDPEVIRHPERLPEAKRKVVIPAERSGCLERMICDEIGVCAMLLGGGREKLGDVIDPGVGLMLHKKVGDKVEQGEPLATLYVNEEKRLQEVMERFCGAVLIGDAEPEMRQLIHEVIR